MDPAGSRCADENARSTRTFSPPRNALATAPFNYSRRGRKPKVVPPKHPKRERTPTHAFPKYAKKRAWCAKNGKALPKCVPQKGKQRARVFWQVVPVSGLYRRTLLVESGCLQLQSSIRPGCGKWQCGSQHLALNCLKRGALRHSVGHLFWKPRAHRVKDVKKRLKNYNRKRMQWPSQIGQEICINVWCIKNQTNHSSETLMSVVRF